MTWEERTRTLPAIVHLRLLDQVGGHMSSIVKRPWQVVGKGSLLGWNGIEATIEATIRAPEIHGRGMDVACEGQEGSNCRGCAFGSGLFIEGGWM